MIKIYTKTHCPYCDQAKQMLDAFGYEYESINIEENSAARDFVIHEGHRTVPQIYVNDVLIKGGFNTLKEQGINAISTLLEG